MTKRYCLHDCPTQKEGDLANQSNISNEKPYIKTFHFFVSRNYCDQIGGGGGGGGPIGANISMFRDFFVEATRTNFFS